MRVAEMQAQSGRTRTPAFDAGTGVGGALTTVQWTVVPPSGLATEGEPRTCEREQGQRGEASAVGEPFEASTERENPGFRGTEPGAMALFRPSLGSTAARPANAVQILSRRICGTFAETKVTRRAGATPR
jgi:hypothetical protein